MTHEGETRFIELDTTLNALWETVDQGVPRSGT